jgi:hypothetical protein
VYFNQRSTENNNQNVSEPFISLGINALLNLCIGSISAKMFQIDGKNIPEFVFARLHNSLLAQLASAGLASDQMDDEDLEFLPVYFAPELAKAHGQDHRGGVSWTLLAGPEFDEILEATKTNQTAAHVRSVFLNGYDIVEKQRVGMAADGEVLSGCHWQGCGSLRSSARCPNSDDRAEAEIEAVLPELNYEYLNSLAAVVTSQSHQYLVIAGGRELLKLWKKYPAICNVDSPLAYMYSYLEELITRMLNTPSPDVLKDHEKESWSIIQAVDLAGFKSRDMCIALAKCVAFLHVGVCQVNRSSLNDSAHKDFLIPSSIARLEESLAVSAGNHSSTVELYSGRTVGRVDDRPCPTCKKVFLSQYASRSGFNYHVSRCGKSSEELAKKKKPAAKKKEPAAKKKKPAAKKKKPAAQKK